MSFQLGKFRDIPLTIHWSFSLLLAGIIVVLSITEGIQTGILYGIGALALFASVIIHEFMHSYVAHRYGYDTDEIVLYPLGGMSKIEELPTNPKQEFMIAFMGPVTNFLLAALILGLVQLIAPFDFQFLGRSFLGLLTTYGLLNIGLGLFNLLIPAIPMDGGRLLRSILATQVSFPEATRKAVAVSKVLAVIMGLIGFAYDFWLVIIAIFIYIASSSELEESLTRYILEDVPLVSIPTTGIHDIDPSMTVEKLVDKMLDEGETIYLVKENNQILGAVGLSNIQLVDKEDRGSTAVQSIMTRDLPSIQQGATAKQALKRFQNDDIGFLVVRSQGEIAGILTHRDLIDFIRIKSVEKISSSTKSSRKKISNSVSPS